MAKVRYYFSNQKQGKRLINFWDFIALIIIFGALFALAWGTKQMVTPYQIGQPLKIYLAPSYLPGYAISTILRMFIAMVFSLLFTFTMGTWAAKSKRAEQIIIPTIDILQSVPVLSFLSITIVGFIHLFPNSLLGPECASIFAIFTAQAWNMALGFYQSLKSVPANLKEAAIMFHLSAWQRFWKLEVPFSMSSLLWNSMMSMSASWFFVVLSEAISVSNQEIRLPGIGSYIAVAIEQQNIMAVIYSILAMLVVILLYDQLLFRPLIKWSDKFKVDDTPGERAYHSWFNNLLLRSKSMQRFSGVLNRLADGLINARWLNTIAAHSKSQKKPAVLKHSDRLWNALILIFLVIGCIILLRFILSQVHPYEILHVFYLGLATSARVIATIIFSSILWIPIGVYIGMRPQLAQSLQPVIQILAAFPANLIYPIMVITIVKFNLNVQIWVTPLMILGTQWYILFNVIAGASNIPKDLYQAAQNLGIHGWQWWKRLALPGIFPFFITGAITAAGGAWNASIVAEWVSWGNTTLRATGLGEYIHAYTNDGDFPRIALGTAMMCLFVLAFNHLLWRPLYRLAENRYQINT